MFLVLVYDIYIVYTCTWVKVFKISKILNFRNSNLKTSNSSRSRGCSGDSLDGEFSEKSGKNIK